MGSMETGLIATAALWWLAALRQSHVPLVGNLHARNATRGISVLSTPMEDFLANVRCSFKKSEYNVFWHAVDMFCSFAPHHCAIFFATEQRVVSWGAVLRRTGATVSWTTRAHLVMLDLPIPKTDVKAVSIFSSTSL